MPHNSSKSPFPWIKKIAPYLPEIDQIPLFGRSPSFDWEQISSQLAARFGVRQISVRPGNQEWRNGDAIREGLGENPLALAIDAAPLRGSAYWIMPRKDLAKFSSWMLNGKARSKALSSEILQEGFYRYLVLEAIDVFHKAAPLEKLTPILKQEADIPESYAFCVDVEIDFDHSTCWGRLVIPDELRKSWVHYFESASSDRIPTELAQSLELNLGLKTGSVLLRQDQWEEIRPGDFIVLDKGSYDAHRSTGAASLMLGQTPLFHVKIKQNKIQLLDYAFLYEDATDMEKKMPADDESAFAKQGQPVQPAEEEEGVALRELPIYVTVELARFRITLAQLMQLTPGNLLELPIHPDQSVTLTVNGQKVGRAELAHLGETLGIRILELK